MTETNISKIYNISFDKSLSKDSLQKIEFAKVLTDLVLAEYPKKQVKNKTS